MRRIGTAALTRAVVSGCMLLVVAGATAARAQGPAPMAEKGCCCVAVKGGKVGCGQKSQADCLAEQPRAPLYDHLPDWASAVATSQGQEAEKVKTGWRAGPCGG